MGGGRLREVVAMRELIVFSADIVNKQSTFGTSNGTYFFSFCFNCLILTQCYSFAIKLNDKKSRRFDLSEAIFKCE